MVRHRRTASHNGLTTPEIEVSEPDKLGRSSSRTGAQTFVRSNSFKRSNSLPMSHIDPSSSTLGKVVSNYAAFDDFQFCLCGYDGSAAANQYQMQQFQSLELDEGSVIGDDQSTGSSSTIGEFFSDLVSLPSMDDSSTLSSGNISALGTLAVGELNLSGTSADLDLRFFQPSKDGISKLDSLPHFDTQDLGTARESAEGNASAKVEPSSSLAVDVAPLNEMESIKTRRQRLCKELHQAIEIYGRYDLRCANIAAALGDLFCDSDDDEQAAQVYEEAVAIYITKLGDHHDITLDCKTRLAGLLAKQEKYDEAMDVYYNVTSMRKALNGDKNNTAVADLLVQVANVLGMKQRNVQAIKEMKRALKIYREILTDSHPTVATTVEGIARLYTKTGDARKASCILEEVVKLRVAMMGVNHSVVASSLLELATSQERTGYHTEALRSVKKSYAIYCKLLGREHVTSLSSLERVALCYQTLGQKDKAITALVGVLRGRKKTLGDRNRLVAQTFLKMGSLLRSEGHYQKALRCIKHSLSIYVSEGKDMRDVAEIAKVMHELALIHQSKGRLIDACKVFQQEVAIRQKMGYSELPQIVKTLNQLGMTELSMKNNKAALKHFMEALAICEKKEGMELDFGLTLLNTGSALRAINHKQRANEAFLEAFKIFDKQGLDGSHSLVKRTVAEMNRMGEKCVCAGTKCAQVPCQWTYSKLVERTRNV